jgi:transmembrane sensor
MTSQEFDNILQRYLQDACTVEEKRLVEEWFAAMGKSVEDIELRPHAATRDKLWAKISEDTHETAPQLRHFSYRQLGRVAAALLLLAVSTFLIIRYLPSGEKQVNSVAVSGEMIRIVNSSNAVERIALKDGSFVSLQPGGEVSFPEVFGASREVHLSGEAFFEIARDEKKPFLVHANEVTTKVLGTSFRVKAYKQEKEVVVAVKTGKVSVYANPAGVNGSRGQRPEVVLTPNQQVIYKRNENLVVKTLVEDPQPIVKKQSVKALYTNAPVTEILAALEQNYGISIQYDANILSHCTLTSDLTEEGLYEQIAIICNALGARYTIDEMSIIIEAKGCR